MQQYPGIIVYCQTIQDVSNAVIWAQKNCMPLRIRSGGHNYEGYSNGNCALVIDISEMNDIEIEEEQGLVHVLAGVTNKQVYDYVSSRGYPFPGGTCPTVGVSGYSLGGGWGLSCRYLGLGCDSVEEIHLIDADGRLISASRTNNEDLFWACRGAGGGNFGVVVSITFRLPPKVESVTLIEIEYLHVTSQKQLEFWEMWQSWLNQADYRMTLISRVYHSVQDGLAMLVRGIFYGTSQEAEQQLQAFLQADPTKSNLEETTFLQAVQILGSGYPAWEMFSAASRFVMCDLTPAEIFSLIQMVQNPPEGSVFTGFSLYALGGKVAEVGQDDTAFYYRKAKYILWMSTVWEDPIYVNPGRAWINTHFPLFASMTEGAYVNFPYRYLPHWLCEYFGCHTERLQAIKQKYDPCGVFSFPQGLRVSEHFETVWCAGPEWDTYHSAARQSGMNYRGFRYVGEEPDWQTTESQEDPPSV
ncbi:FAD-binding oxidoreductase [Clostridium minihomine]|uniref:FAD-binding oxidoreductase n=1 Tax=Clostridium minihomine TaxID=2045012 RepID=UPI000C77E8D6|nr:FAD-binding oxidoreductase [Clostridium minihomine]